MRMMICKIFDKENMGGFFMKKRYVLLLCAAALSIGASCSSVSAHGVFIANRFDQKALAPSSAPL